MLAINAAKDKQPLRLDAELRITESSHEEECRVMSLKQEEMQLKCPRHAGLTSVFIPCARDSCTTTEGSLAILHAWYI
jgi:hypothetical protein